MEREHRCRQRKRDAERNERDETSEFCQTRESEGSAAGGVGGERPG